MLTVLILQQHTVTRIYVCSPYYTDTRKRALRRNETYYSSRESKLISLSAQTQFCDQPILECAPTQRTVNRCVRLHPTIHYFLLLPCNYIYQVSSTSRFQLADEQEVYRSQCHRRTCTSDTTRHPYILLLAHETRSAELRLTDSRSLTKTWRQATNGTPTFVRRIETKIYDGNQRLSSTRCRLTKVLY